MKRLFLSIFIVTLIAGCGIFGSDGDGRFGAWEKVNSDRGEYRGIDAENTISTKVPAKVISDFSTASDTVIFDSLYINNDSQVNMSLEKHTLTDANYDALLVFEYPEIPYETSDGWDLEYVTDSTAFNIETNRFSISDGNIYTESRVINNCTGNQADQEYLNVKYYNGDRSQVTVFQIRVDGMTDLIEDMDITCKD